MKKLKPIAININFDSLNEAFGFPKGFRDPSFFDVFDRFMNLSLKYNFKYSIFIIGKDLKNPEIYARVNEWSQMGHEIGNHTWSHPMNLGALPENKICEEIERAHEIITKCTGKQPKGFIAPAWSTSKNIIKKLVKLRYTYDTSLFPSLLLYPMIMKIGWNHINNYKRLIKVLNRRDWLYPLTKPTQPFIVNESFEKISIIQKESLVILPLPTNKTRTVSYWHTLAFVFGYNYANAQLKKMLNKEDYFYYLLHPADLIGEEDINQKYNHSLERINVPLNKKIDIVNSLFEVIDKSQREIITLEQMAKLFIKEQANKEKK